MLCPRLSADAWLYVSDKSGRLRYVVVPVDLEQKAVEMFMKDQIPGAEPPDGCE